jgi:16S rRNA (adenine1518-N6/adenine1519-N6)-dimethyltransferase
MTAAHRPRKRFGQHFLKDSAIIGDIVAAIDPQPEDRLVEIGPVSTSRAPMPARCSP